MRCGYLRSPLHLRAGSSAHSSLRRRRSSSGWSSCSSAARRHRRLRPASSITDSMRLPCSSCDSPLHRMSMGTLLTYQLQGGLRRCTVCPVRKCCQGNGPICLPRTGVRRVRYNVTKPFFQYAMRVASPVSIQFFHWDRSFLRKDVTLSAG